MDGDSLGSQLWGFPNPLLCDVVALTVHLYLLYHHHHNDICEILCNSPVYSLIYYSEEDTFLIFHYFLKASNVSCTK